MKLVLVRHGETLGESSIRLNGATDVALSPLGVRQMEAVGRALRGAAFSRVIASPLRRSAEAAAIVYPAVPPTVVPDLREVHFGRWETLTWAEVEEREPALLAQMHASRADFTYPDGESRRAFRARVEAAARAELSHATGDVLAVLHKGVIKATVAVLTGMSAAEAWHLPCELGGITRLARGAAGWTIEALDETEHLTGC